MNTLKIINNNVHGQDDGENYFTDFDFYGIEVLSDGTSYDTNPPNIIISENVIDGNYSGAIKSANNSNIIGNKITGTFTNGTAVSSLKNSNIENNKINADCQVSISTTTNSNIVNNNISGFTQYGIKASGKNISGNIVSRNDNQVITAFVAGEGGSWFNTNQPTIVVDNVFSHESCDPSGLDKILVKRSSDSWVIERNLPDYSIETPIKRIKTVDSLEELSKLTEMAHNDVALVSSLAEPSTSSYGLWRFVKGSTKDELGEAFFYPGAAVISVRSLDKTGSWHAIDYSKFNAPLGIPRLDYDGYININSSGIKSIQVIPSGQIDVIGSASSSISDGYINLIDGGRLNVRENSQIVVSKGAKIDSSSGGIIYGGYRNVVKFLTLTDGAYPEIKPGTDSWADEYIVDNKSTANTAMGTIKLSAAVPDIQDYIGVKIRFSYNLKPGSFGGIFFINLYDSAGATQAQVSVFKDDLKEVGNFPVGNSSPTMQSVEFLLIQYPESGEIVWQKLTPRHPALITGSGSPLIDLITDLNPFG